MKPAVYENREEGIKCVYKNEDWLVCIKNWKPDNDITGVVHLEVHHKSDEQFILAAGKAILITAGLKNGQFTNISLTSMEHGKVYNVPKEMWFYSITQRNSKMIYIQRADTTMENSELKNLTQEQVTSIQAEARKLLAEG